MAIDYAGKDSPRLTGYDLGYVMKSHPLYQNYIQRWQFLNAIWEGGYQFFLGRYLEPYHYESQDDYIRRLKGVALDNHCRSVTGIYSSFLFRKPIKRDYGSLDVDPAVDQFLQDADLDGRSFDQFMRDVATYSMVYGHCWVAIDKPVSNARTRADELNQGIRPYVQIFTPENVLDWDYERDESGLYRLSYLKVKEETQRSYAIVREYTPTMMRAFRLEKEDATPELIQEMPITTNRIPCIPVYSQRSSHRGVGISSINDIADMSKMIYEEYSEIEQIIRLTNHPTLVKTAGTEVSAGAGAIIQMEEGIDPGLRPFLLQPNGASIDSVIASVQQKIEAIDRMACLGGIRSIESRRLSGIGLQTEFQMLNAKLADIAHNLEHAEEQIWRCFAMLQGTTFDGEITYPRSFSIQDKANEVQMIKQAKESNPMDPKLIAAYDEMMFKALTEDDGEQYMEVMNMEMQHPVTTPDNRQAHIKEMIMEGLTDERMLELHPEITQADIDTAKASMNEMQPTQQVQMMQGEIPASREIVVEGYQTKFHYMCGSAILFAQKMVREGKSGPTLRQLVEKSDRVFEIEAMIEQTRTNTPQQIEEARQLVEEIKSLARELNGDDALVSYMDLHIDAIVDPSLAGSLKVNGEV